MTRRSALTAIVASMAVAAGSAGGANAATTASHACGKVAAAGASWQFGVAEVPCASAKSLVSKLAPKVPRSGAAHIGDYHGLRCLGAGRRGKRAIECMSRDGKLVVAVARG